MSSPPLNSEFVTTLGPPAFAPATVPTAPAGGTVSTTSSLSPALCCPEWLWNNDNGGGMNSGPWKTLEARGWMRQMGVKTHVVEKDGDQILR